MFGWKLFGDWPAFSRRNVRQARELSYGSPWEDRAREISYGYQPNDQTVYPGLEPDWLGRFPKVEAGELEMVPALGAEPVWRIEILDGDELTILHTDQEPVIMVTEQ